MGFLRFPAYGVWLLLLAALQSVFPVLFGLSGMRPLLVLPLVVHFALRMLTIPGALCALLVGLVQEAADGLPVGLGAFGAVALFVLAKILLAGIRREGLLFDLFVGAGGALAWHGLTGGAQRLLGPSLPSSGWGALVAAAVFSAVATGLSAPVVLRVTRWIDGWDRRGRSGLGESSLGGSGGGRRS